MRRVRAIPKNSARRVGRHEDVKRIWHLDNGLISDLDGWRVLHWRDGPARDVLALSEQVWEFAADGLLFCEPAYRSCLLVGDVGESDFDLGVFWKRVGQVHLDGVAEVLVWSRDVESGILPDLASSVHRNEFSPRDSHAFSIEKYGCHIFFHNLHRVRCFSIELLEVEIDGEI